jgi:hypothetical protein
MDPAATLAVLRDPTEDPAVRRAAGYELSSAIRYERTFIPEGLMPAGSPRFGGNGFARQAACRVIEAELAALPARQLVVRPNGTMGWDR